jgi:hypothetical protein
MCRVWPGSVKHVLCTAVPVDDFFETYVEQLGAQGVQKDAPAPVVNNTTGMPYSKLNPFSVLEPGWG